MIVENECCVGDGKVMLFRKVLTESTFVKVGVIENILLQTMKHSVNHLYTQLANTGNITADKVTLLTDKGNLSCNNSFKMFIIRLAIAEKNILRRFFDFIRVSRHGMYIFRRISMIKL